MMLDADVSAGIVVDRAGRVSGLLLTDMVASFLRAADGAPGPDGAGDGAVRQPAPA